MFTQEQALGRGAASLTSDMYTMAMQYATYYPPRQEYIQSEISYGSRPTRHTTSTIHTQPTRKQLPQQLQQQIRQRSKQHLEQIMYNNANPNDSNENALNLSKCGLNRHAEEFVPISAFKEKKCKDKHAPVRASAAATGRDDPSRGDPARGAPAHSVPAAVSAASVNVMFNRYNNNDNDNNDNNDKKNVFVGAPERLLVAPMDTRLDPAYGSDFAIMTPITDPGTEVSLFGTISTADTADNAADTAADTGNNVNTVNAINTVSVQCGSGSVTSVHVSASGVIKNDSDNSANKSFNGRAISGKYDKVSKVQKKEKLSKLSKLKEELEKQSMFMRYEPCDEVDPCGKEHSCFRFDQQTIEDGMAGKRVHRPQRQRKQQPQFETLSQTVSQTGRQTETTKTQTQTTEMFERVTLCDWICEDSDKYRGIFNLGLRAKQIETYQARARYLLSKIAHMLYCFHKSDEMCYFDGVSKKNISLALQWEKKKKVEMKDEGGSDCHSGNDSDEYDIFIVPMFDKPPKFARRYKEDVLYLGVLMYHMLTYSPFHDECGPRPDMDPQKIEDRLQWLRRDPKVPKLALDLVEHMLCDENVRYTMTEVMEHEYIKSGPDTFPSVSEDVIEFTDPPEEFPEWPQFPEPPEVAPLSSIYKV